MSGISVPRGAHSLSQTSMQWLGRVLCTIGGLLLVHASYSTYEHLSYLKTIGRTSQDIPFDIVAECLLATLAMMIGTIYVAGPLREALLEKTTVHQTVEEVDARPSFVAFNRRGRVLFAS